MTVAEQVLLERQLRLTRAYVTELTDKYRIAQATIKQLTADNTRLEQRLATIEVERDKLKAELADVKAEAVAMVEEWRAERRQRLEEMPDDKIDTSDIPEATKDFFKNAKLVKPK